MINLRSGGFIVLTIASVAIYFALAPDDVEYSPSDATYRVLIDLAMSDFEANDARTDSAPQQQVVNGWIARDLLQILAMESADQLEGVEAIATQEPDERVPALLVLVVVAIAWWGITEEVGRVRSEVSTVPALPA